MGVRLPGIAEAGGVSRMFASSDAAFPTEGLRSEQDDVRNKVVRRRQ
jgi:hypothetical protein